MKTLYIMRHPHKIESSRDNDDFDVKLSDEGIEEATTMSKKLASLNVNLDLIVASPAYRTRATADILAKYLKYDKNIMLNEVLYNAFLNELIETITYTFDSVNNLLIIGHNPSLAALAFTFVDYREKFEPAMVLKIEFDCDSWIDIDKNKARLIWVEKV